MKTQRSILIAFILNFVFSVFEFVGSFFTGSTALASDAVHDVGDAISIGISCILERKSKKKPDEKYTYGYSRYSVLGGLFSTIVLIVGSIIMILNAVIRIINPVIINYNGMIFFAVIGVILNSIAAFITNNKSTLNQRAVNLHMLEDVLGWVVVLLGAVIMRFTKLSVIDPIMSIAVSVFILIHAIKNIKELLDLILEKVPDSIDTLNIKDGIKKIDNVLDVHHIHIWSLDGKNTIVTMHVVTDNNPEKIKESIRNKLKEYEITHITIEIEKRNEQCEEKSCNITANNHTCNCYHHTY